MVAVRSCSHSEHQVVSSQGNKGGGRVVSHAGHRAAHPNLPLQPLSLEVPNAQLPIQAGADQQLVAGVSCYPSHTAPMRCCPLLAFSRPVPAQTECLLYRQHRSNV